MGELRGHDLVFPLTMLALASVSVWQGNAHVLAGGAPAALAVVTVGAGRMALGWANAVTWLRIGATAGLVLLAPRSTDLAVSAFLIFAFDGVDGTIARRTGTATEFGATLDKECDAFFVLMVSVLLFQQGVAGTWVLIPGAWRYVYSLIVAGVGELRPAPRSNWGRYSYSTSCLCLIAALWEGAPEPWALALAATVVISVSFLRSLYYCLPRS